MSREAAMAVLRSNVENGTLDGELVRLLEEHYDEIDQQRERESREAGSRYYQSLGKRETKSEK